MKQHVLFVLLILNFKTAIGQDKFTSKQPQQFPTIVDKIAGTTGVRTIGNNTLSGDSIDTKIVFSAGSNHIDFVPLSSFNNGLLIEPINRVSNTSIPASFYSGQGGSWSFYTNGTKRFDIDADGYIKTTNTSLLINGATPEESYSMKVHGNAGFDSSLSLGTVSPASSFMTMSLGFKSTFDDVDDSISPHTNTPVAWAAGQKLPVFRMRHPNNVALGSSQNTSTARDFMILPYQYGMAIEYNGVVECWVGEWSIHRGDFYNDVEGKGNGWGGVLWVGDDQDGGGVRATARNNLFRGGDVNYGELSVEKFFGTPNGDFRFRLPSTQNQFQFVYGERGSKNIVAKVSDKGFFIPTVSSVAAISAPEKGQVYFDSTLSTFNGYNGSQWESLSNNLITGSSTNSSDGVRLSYQIPHGLASTPSYFNVVATSANAGTISYVTANAAFLNVFYSSPPPAGTNNLSWNWQVKN